MGLYAAAKELGVEVQVVDAIDFDAKCVEVYNANLPHPVARVADVKKLTRADLPPHDLVIGGPPCQPHSLAGKRLGVDDPRDCLPDFKRLAHNTPYLMENVVPRLMHAPFSVKLNAFDYGDVTTRKRWFYSSHLLYVIETPGFRRFGDIRDHEADRLTLGKGGSTGFLKVGLRGHSASASAFEDDEPLGSFVSNSWHGNELSKLGPMVRCPSLIEMARAHSIPDDFKWCGATKTARGKMIANCWPVGLATAVLRSMLVAMGACEIEGVA